MLATQPIFLVFTCGLVLQPPAGFELPLRPGGPVRRAQMPVHSVAPPEQEGVAQPDEVECGDVPGTDIGCDVAVPITGFRPIRRMKSAIGAVFRTLFIWRCIFVQLWCITNCRRRFSAAPDSAEAIEGRRQVAANLRDTLIRLGPTFIKVGQLLSTRVDVLPPEVIGELARLQNEVPCFSSKRARAVIRQALGKPVGKIYDSFDDTPIASASLAQVHRAVYKGQEVVVKVQRENLLERFGVDLFNIRVVARVADLLDAQTEAVNSNWLGIADTSAGVLYREVDFNNERKCAERFARNFEAFKMIKVPLTVPEASCSRVITMEYVPGVKISDKEALEERGYDQAKLADHLTTSYMEQLCRHGFFHCDPHPGNLAVDDGYPGGRLIYYDFGMMEEVEPHVKKGFVDLTFSIFKNRPVEAVGALGTMGVLRPGVDRFSIERITRSFLEQFEATLELGAQWENQLPADEQRALRRARRAKLGSDLFATQAERPFLFPPKFTFVFRAFTTIDGIGKALTPQYDLTRIAQPYLRELADLRDGSAFRTAAKELFERLGLRPVDLGAVVQQPRSVQRVASSIKRIEEGDVKLRVRTLEVERALERVEARQQVLSGGLLAALLFLVSREVSRMAIVGSRLLSQATMLGALYAAASCWKCFAALSRMQQQARRFSNMAYDDVTTGTVV